MGHPGETPLPSRTWEQAPGKQKTHLPPQVQRQVPQPEWRVL